MLSKSELRRYEKECRLLEYYDKHREFPTAKKRILINLSSEIIEKCKEKIEKREFSRYIENLIRLNVKF